MSFSSKRFILIAAPVIVGVYFSIIVLQVVTSRRTEIFPFFSWSLFSTPVGVSAENYIKSNEANRDSQKKINFIKWYIEVVSVDGVIIEPKTTLISTGEKGIRFQKRLKNVTRYCDKNNVLDCEEYALNILSSYVSGLNFNDQVVFNGLQCIISVEYYLNLLKADMVKFPKKIDCISETRTPVWTLKK